MKVLVIDDHPLIVSALRTVIADLQDDIEVAGVSTAAAAEEALRDDPDVDLVLLDLALGDRSGFDLLADLRKTYPALPVVVVSASDQRRDVLRSIDMGAMGFVSKCTTNTALLDALRVVMAGGIFVPPSLMGMNSSPSAAETPAPGWRTPLHLPALDGGAPLTSDRLLSMGFTKRQSEVLELLLQGQPNKLIARKLNLSVETVKDHVAAVLRRLNVNTRMQAVLAFSEMANGAGTPSWGDPRQSQLGRSP